MAGLSLGLGLGLARPGAGAAAAVAPQNSVLPAISGNPLVGQTLTCSTGTWSGTAPISYGYQWKADGVNISGATASTFVPTSAQIGKAITCTVTATNAAGSGNATSAATATVVAIFQAMLAGTFINTPNAAKQAALPGTFFSGR